MNIQIGEPYRIKIQINNQYGNPVEVGPFSAVLKRNADDYYWDETLVQWQDTLISGLSLTYDEYGSWYNDISGDAWISGGQYTAFFDSLSPNITDSFDLNVVRMTEQWSVTAE